MAGESGNFNLGKGNGPAKAVRPLANGRFFGIEYIDNEYLPTLPVAVCMLLTLSFFPSKLLKTRSLCNYTG
jgi:hypothetical protein